MVDIHSHILWQLDDGARSFEESVAMLRIAEAARTTDIVATPHANQQYRFDPAIIATRIEDISRVPGLNIRIHRGCDFHLMYENIVDVLENPSKYTINGGPYLLTELPDASVPPSVDNILDRLLAAGLTPIITHPERNRVVSRDVKRLTRWVEMGCLIQVTAGSFSGRFGASAKRDTRDMMQLGLVHAVASDAHDPTDRHTRLDEAFNSVAADYGDALATTLFEANPGAIVAGRPVDRRRTADARKKREKRWFFGWG